MAQQRQQRSLPVLFPPAPAARSRAAIKLIAEHKHKAADMDAQALMRINAQEELMFPVEIKVKMLMEQAGMRARASRMASVCTKYLCRPCDLIVVPQSRLGCSLLPFLPARAS